MAFVCTVHESLMMFLSKGLCLSGHELGKTVPDNGSALTCLDFGVWNNFSTLKRKLFFLACLSPQAQAKPSLVSLVYNPRTQSIRRFSWK